jgi:hypothetical protein
MIRSLAALLCAAALAACAAPREEVVTEITPTAAADIPPAVLTAVRAAMPGITVAEAELKVREGRRYYDVEGRMPDGSEIELDLLETNGAWAVVEIQRDIEWAQAPAAVRAAAAARRAVSPVRVIESRQTDGRIIYELFAPGRPATPALEVMWDGRTAAVLAETWPH